jgi:hypothetical protein
MAGRRETPSTESPTTQAPTQTPEAPTEGTAAADGVDLAQELAELRARVENLERYTRVPDPEQVDREEAERDEALLSRVPVNYQEAVAQEAARKRRAERAQRAG